MILFQSSAKTKLTSLQTIGICVLCKVSPKEESQGLRPMALTLVARSVSEGVNMRQTRETPSLTRRATFPFRQIECHWAYAAGLASAVLIRVIRFIRS
jgi:hypothetical protein